METASHKTKRVRAERKRYEEKKLLRAQSHSYNPAPLMTHVIPQQPATVLPVPFISAKSASLPSTGISFTHSAPPYVPGANTVSSSVVPGFGCDLAPIFTSVTSSPDSRRRCSALRTKISSLFLGSHAGQEHLERVMAAGFDFDQIADGDWEAQEVDADDEEHLPARSHSDGSEVLNSR
ncbi:hypothetical protein K435DRAFT_861738 [Dendrothele bispora CBS 962.96]|uniref:Uncharacterized protein n=1 Tax=Dendrothele bispora (strain CBS 962.96) TaxID=1314807 RepID=A0A4S8LUD7_DENBC|nr:hypothetical protein K435DRAFT_861738 [Dendrothele bispora CBS 962.96]